MMASFDPWGYSGQTGDSTPEYSDPEDVPPMLGNPRDQLPYAGVHPVLVGKSNL